MTRSLSFIAVFALSIGTILWGASNALSHASERTVTYQYISDALDALSARPDHVTWKPASPDLARPFSAGDAALIGQAMTGAWHALTLAQNTGQAEILRDGFSGVAQERAEQAVQDASHGGQMIVLTQTALPQFYHLDGSVFQADVEMEVVRYMVENDDLTYHEIVTDHATTTLMNETNGWRVYVHERYDVTPVPTQAPGWAGDRLAGINYYPAATPWRNFWPLFDSTIIAADFARIRDLGATAIRVFLTADYFADPDTQAVALDRLAELLTLAQTAELKVIPTLFDLKPTYEPSGWGQDTLSLRAIMPVLAASPAVTLLDLKNEPDLDFDAHGKGHVLAWLSTMATVARTAAPNVPLTIGWAASDAALELEELVDVVSYHDYAPVETSANRLAAIQAATDLPVMITEIGASSYTAALAMPSTPHKQAAYLSDRLQALDSADGVFVWTLYDFPNVDASAVGGSPWVQRLQSHFGLIRADGTEKPSAAIVSDAFHDFAGR